MGEVELLSDWLELALRPGRRVIYKRLSANDTGATGGHQVGFYIPTRIAFLIAPELDVDELNPRRQIPLRLVSHDQVTTPSLIYYNNALTGGTRNECRLTGFGGRSSPIQDPDSTAAILLVSFDERGRTAEAWLATSADEDTVIEAELGVVEPGTVGYRGPDESGQIALFDTRTTVDGCTPDERGFPPTWLERFPSPTELAAEAARRARATPGDVDRMFMARHECEYSLFRAVERFHLAPRLRGGFATVDDFLTVAQTVLQRRKSRAGRSLELHLERVFDESGVAYTRQPETEPGHRPDFVFPSITQYHAAQRGDATLVMLAAKSTLRDRWRQVLREADKIPIKHVFTLDDGLSPAQVRAIEAEGIRLVVPASRLRRYPATSRANLLSLARFVAMVGHR